MNKTQVKLDAIRKLLEMPKEEAYEKRPFSTAPKNGKPFLVFYEGISPPDPYILHWSYYFDDEGSKSERRWSQYPMSYFDTTLAEKYIKYWYPLPGVSYKDSSKEIDDEIPF